MNKSEYKYWQWDVPVKGAPAYTVELYLEAFGKESVAVNGVVVGTKRTYKFKSTHYITLPDGRLGTITISSPGFPQSILTVDEVVIPRKNGEELYIPPINITLTKEQRRLTILNAIYGLYPLPMLLGFSSAINSYKIVQLGGLKIALDFLLIIFFIAIINSIIKAHREASKNKTDFVMELYKKALVKHRTLPRVHVAVEPKDPKARIRQAWSRLIFIIFFSFASLGLTYGGITINDKMLLIWGVISNFVLFGFTLALLYKTRKQSKIQAINFTEALCRVFQNQNLQRVEQETNNNIKRRNRSNAHHFAVFLICMFVIYFELINHLVNNAFKFFPSTFVSSPIFVISLYLKAFSWLAGLQSISEIIKSRLFVETTNVN